MGETKVQTRNLSSNGRSSENDGNGRFSKLVLIVINKTKYLLSHKLGRLRIHRCVTYSTLNSVNPEKMPLGMTFILFKSRCLTSKQICM